MMYIRSVVHRTLPEVQERYRYGVPFFHCDNKPLCYLNIPKNTTYVDVAFVQGILLEEEFPVLEDGRNRKQVRSIRLFALEELDEKEFQALLLRAAILLKESRRPRFLD
jgi:hypothetical protein